MPRIDYYRKRTESTSLEQVKDSYSHQKIMEWKQSVQLNCIWHCHVLQWGTIHDLSIRSEQIRYQRTPLKWKVSEGVMMCYLRKYFFHFMNQSPELRITQLIQKMQETPVTDTDLPAS